MPLGKLNMKGLKLSELQGKVQGATDGAGKAMMIVEFVAKLLPHRKQKKFIDAMKFGALGVIYNGIKGRKFTTGEYVLGERFVKQVIGENIKSRNDVLDEEVPTAQTFFTFAFGVRITTSQDLDALDQGVTAYQARPEKTDIPLALIERAVRLKKQYYSIGTYNKGKWDLSHMENEPYQGLIPGIKLNTYLNADLGEKLKIVEGNIMGVTNFIEDTSAFNQVPVLTGVPLDNEESFRNGEVKELETVTFSVKVQRWLKARGFVNALGVIVALFLLVYLGIKYVRKPKKRRF